MHRYWASICPKAGTNSNPDQIVKVGRLTLAGIPAFYPYTFVVQGCNSLALTYHRAHSDILRTYEQINMSYCVMNI